MAACGFLLHNQPLNLATTMTTQVEVNTNRCTQGRSSHQPWQRNGSPQRVTLHSEETNTSPTLIERREGRIEVYDHTNDCSANAKPNQVALHATLRKRGDASLLAGLQTPKMRNRPLIYPKMRNRPLILPPLGLFKPSGVPKVLEQPQTVDCRPFRPNP